LGEKQIEKIIETVGRLEEMQDITQLSKLLSPGGKGGTQAR
jgi:hypothetical protein